MEREERGESDHEAPRVSKTTDTLVWGTLLTLETSSAVSHGAMLVILAAHSTAGGTSHSLLGMVERKSWEILALSMSSSKEDIARRDETPEEG
jgi:hypothetical protein